MTTADVVKSWILAFLQPTLSANKIDTTTLPEDADLRAMGIVDSLTFLQLLSHLEQRLGAPIDLSELDPTELTTIGALSRQIAGSRPVQSRT